MKKQIISILFALLFLANLPLQTLAATHDVGNFDDMSNAFQDTDSQVTVNLTNNVSWSDTLTAGQDQTYSINGNGYSMNNVSIAGSGTVNIEADINSTSKKGTALTVSDGAQVNVTGDITSQYTGVDVDDSTVTITGDIDSRSYSLISENSNVTVTGDMSSSHNGGVYALDDSEVTVTGDITAYNSGVSAHSSSVTVTGDVSGSSGVSGSGNSEITINGDISGRSSGVAVTEESNVTINGKVNSNSCGVSSHSYGQGENYDCTVTVTDGIYSKYDGISMSESTLEVNADIYCERTGVTSYYGDLTVNGNIDAGDTGIVAEATKVTVNGDIQAGSYGIEADTASVTVTGDLSASDIAVYAEDVADIHITGDVSSDTNTGVLALNSSVTVTGDVNGKDSGALAISHSYVTVYGTVSGDYCGIGASESDVYAYNAHGGYVGVDASVSRVGIQENVTGDKVGMYAFGSNVTVLGNVTGQDTGMEIRCSPHGSGQIIIGGTLTGSDNLRIEEGENGPYVRGGSIAVSSYLETFDPSCLPSLSIGTITGGASRINSIWQDENHQALVNHIMGITPPASGGNNDDDQTGSNPEPDQPGINPDPDQPGSNPGGPGKPGTPDTPPITALPAPLNPQIQYLNVTGSETFKIGAVVRQGNAIIWSISEFILDLLMQEHTGAIVFDCSTFSDVTSLRIPEAALKILTDNGFTLEVRFASGSRTFTAAELQQLPTEAGGKVISVG